MDPPAMMNGEAYNLADIWQFPVNVINGRGGFGMGLGRFSDLIRVGGSGCDEYEEHGSRKRKDLELEDEEEEDDPFKGGDSTSNGHGNALSDGSNGDAKRIKAAGKPMGDESHEGGAEAEQEPSSGKNTERKATEAPPKQDYIHVRARRGQATDSHSLAERARREKISERMKILQDLVPGCNKVIGKALVLDEIINYVQSLQRQVEFLSMKLEAVNTKMNQEIEVFPAKDFWHQTFDPSSMAFDSQATRGYSRGPSPEWLHMQVGSGFERTS